MKITHPSSPPIPDLPRKNLPHRKPPRRKIKRGSPRPASGKRGGPPTPLLRWKFDEVSSADKSSEAGAECGGRRARKKGGAGIVSSRGLAAALWRLQAAEAGGGREEPRRPAEDDGDRLGFYKHIGHEGERIPSYHGSRGCGSESKGQPRSPCSVNGPVNGYTHEPQASFKFSNFAMEGATKWDPICPDKNEEPGSFQFFNQDKNQNQNAVAMVSELQSEVEQARRRIEDLESEQISSKKKLKQFLLKLSEEKATWRSREHEKVRAIIGDIKAELIRERKNCQRLEVVNSKLVNEVAETKLALKRYMQEFEKERKNRELVEEVCDELAKEIGEDKAEVDSLKTECMKIREEVDDERKMLQMAEVWREERVQMKLIDAKVTLEDKYSQMNKLIVHLERFLGSKSGELEPREIKEAEMLHQAAASVKVQDGKEFNYEPPPPRSDNILSIFKEIGMLMGERQSDTSEREIEPCDDCSPRSYNSEMYNRHCEPHTPGGDRVSRLSNEYGSENDDLDEDRSGWETVSHADDQGSSFTPDESVTSLNKMIASLDGRANRESNVSGSGTEWEGNGGDETPATEVSGVSSIRSKNSKKMSSISRLWRSGSKNSESYRVISVDGMKARPSNGEGSMSPDRGCSKARYNNTPSDLGAQWTSPDTGIPQMGRGKKGCMEWPRGQKNSLKTQLLEAREESQKMQLRQVLKQKT